MSPSSDSGSYTTGTTQFQLLFNTSIENFVPEIHSRSFVSYNMY